MKDKPKILIGGSEVGGWIQNYAIGFKKLGYETTTVVQEKANFFSSINYDYVLKDYAPRSSFDLLRKIKYQKQINKLIDNHDIFIFLWAGNSIVGNFIDYPKIKRLHKKIITICVGSDVRYWPALLMEYPNLNPGTDFLTKWQKPHYLKNKFIYSVTQTERYSDVIFSLPDQSSLFTKPYYHLPIPLDLTNYSMNICTNQKLKILHLPSSNYKGSEIIAKTLKELGTNPKLEIILPDKMSNQKLLKLLSEVDILVDEIIYPGPGMQGLEAIASGALLLTKHQDKMCPRFNPPLININHKNIKNKLLEIIKNTPLRKKMRADGLNYIRDNNDCTIVAQHIIEVLKGNIKPDYHPTFYQKNKNAIPDSMIEYLKNNR